jgi:peptidoglycan/xylan/chitin deacetylase (PgdA/CDA1 family)
MQASSDGLRHYRAAAAAMVIGLLMTTPIDADAQSQKVPPANNQTELASCPQNRNALGTSRFLTVDAPLAVGTLQYRHTLPLAPKEIVLTFDDGPNPQTTPHVLDALDAHCVKATFFLVGWAAERYPDLVRDIAASGHTIASHSWSHRNLQRLAASTAKADIEHGFASLQNIADKHSGTASPRATESGPKIAIAPFFRFPGLNAPNWLVDYLRTNGQSVFSCDIGTDDWRPITAAEIQRRALRNIAFAGQGIVIMHDTRPQTALALPQLLTSLKEKGYRVVHIVPRQEKIRLEAFRPQVWQ